MNLIRTLSHIMLAVVFTTASYLLAKLSLYFNHTDREKNANHQTRIILSFIWGITFISSVFFLRENDDYLFITKNIVIFHLFSMIAYSDVLIRRIPLITLILSAVMGIFIGVLNSQFWTHLLGGVVHSVMGFFIYYGGRRYLMKKNRVEVDQLAFGWGDVYATGALGFLFGFPIGIFSLLMTLIIAILCALIGSMIHHKRFLKSQMRLGFYFFISAVLTSIFVGSL